MSRHRLQQSKTRYRRHRQTMKASEAYPRLRYFGTHSSRQGYYASDIFYDKKTGAQRFSVEYRMRERGVGQWEILIAGNEHEALDPEYGDDIIDTFKERLQAMSAVEGEKKVLQWIQRFERRKQVET